MLNIHSGFLPYSHTGYKYLFKNQPNQISLNFRHLPTKLMYSEVHDKSWLYTISYQVDLMGRGSPEIFILKAGELNKGNFLQLDF